jgi:hypothetical protein
VISGLTARPSQDLRRYCGLRSGLEFAINCGWHEQRSEFGGFAIRIGSLVFDRSQQCAGFSVIRRLG